MFITEILYHNLNLYFILDENTVVMININFQLFFSYSGLTCMQLIQKTLSYSNQRTVARTKHLGSPPYSNPRTVTRTKAFTVAAILESTHKEIK